MFDIHRQGLESAQDIIATVCCAAAKKSALMLRNDAEFYRARTVAGVRVASGPLLLSLATRTQCHANSGNVSCQDRRSSRNLKITAVDLYFARLLY